jgi:Ca2+/Na+ antiporter
MYKITDKQLSVLWMFGSLISIVLFFSGIGMIDADNTLGVIIGVIIPLIILGTLIFYSFGWKNYKKQLDK